jgi:hypothetical protein
MMIIVYLLSCIIEIINVRFWGGVGKKKGGIILFQISNENWVYSIYRARSLIIYKFRRESYELKIKN